MTRALPLLTATGLLWAVGVAIQPDSGSTPAARYAHVAAHQSREGIAGLVFLAVAALLVLSGIVLWARASSGPGAGAVRAGAALIGLASTWLAATYAAFDMSFLQLVQEKVPLHTAYRIIDGEATPWQPFFDVTLLCVLLGPAILAFGLRRSALTSWLPLVLWVAGILAYAGTEFVLKPAQVAAMLVCTVALFLMGRAADSTLDSATSQSLTTAA